MLIGYARVSRSDPKLGFQCGALGQLGCHTVSEDERNRYTPGGTVLRLRGAFTPGLGGACALSSRSAAGFTPSA